MPRTTVGHYEILEKLGSGGMGVVYKARDTRLGRFLALKLLPAEVVADRERRLRFLQEAKLASALNHPNIVTVYDVGDCADGMFIAMEYVSGETLGSLINGKPLPPGKALNYAVQAADALAAAHAAGVVHRDVKPANVMVTGTGQVKVVDFGIAKLTEPPAGEGSTTITERPRTEAGEVMGTIAYMSPEQAEGRFVDGRSDIFSFGATLYEMLSGCRPFQGATRLAVLTAILREDPVPLRQVNRSVPPELERVVARCLEKDPSLRFQHATDLKVALEWLERDIATGRLTAAEPGLHPRRPKRARTVAVVIVLGAIALAAALYRWWPGASARQPLPLPAPTMLTFDLGLTVEPALSADGKLLAYASDRSGDGNLDIWVQQLPGGEPIRRTRGPADEDAPHFSRDGSRIVFMRSGEGVFVIPALAGQETLIAPGGLHPRFSPDGTKVVYWVGEEDNPAPSGRVFVTPIDRSASVELATGFADARFPLWAPDGKRVLFQGIRSPDDEPEWWVLPVEGGPAVNTGILAALRRQGLSPIPGPGDWDGNNLLFSAHSQKGRHLWQIVLKPPGWRPTGPAEQITFGPASEGYPSVASDRQVAFSSWTWQNNLWRLALLGRPAARIEHLSGTAAIDTHPSMSADGKVLVFLSRRSENLQVWIRDLASHQERALTIGAGDKSCPTLSPDGSQVAYAVAESTTESIYVTPTDRSGGAGVTRRACQNCGEPSDWTRDGTRILHLAGRPQSVRLLDPNSGASIPVLQHPTYKLDQAHVSPDGRWIAFVATVGPDRTRVFISPFRDGATSGLDEWIPATSGTAWDDKPRWLEADSLVFYSNRDHFGCLWKQRLDPVSKRPLGPPEPVYHFHTPRLSLRTQYPTSFEIAASRDTLVVNLIEMAGNIWRTAVPQRR
jgi:eukaryotic-like serine/threonine-protein kinase